MSERLLFIQKTNLDKIKVLDYKENTLMKEAQREVQCGLCPFKCNRKLYRHILTLSRYSAAQFLTLFQALHTYIQDMYVCKCDVII